MYNAKTSKFVLWWNFVTEGWETNNTAFEHQHWSTLATATSDTPQGPYTIAHPPPIPMGTGNQSYAHGVSAAAPWRVFVSEASRRSCGRTLASSRTRTARATLSTTPTITAARVSTATPWTCSRRILLPPRVEPRASSCGPSCIRSAPGLSLTIVGTGGVDGRQRSRRRGAGDAQAQEHLPPHHFPGLLLLQLWRAGFCLHGAPPARALHLPCETFPA